MSSERIATIREGQPRTVRELTTHALTLRQATAREEDRSIEGVFATEAVVQSLDLRTYETIDEILLMSGFQPPSGGQTQLYDSHPEKYAPPTVADVRGAGREIKISGQECIGRLFFASDQPSFDMWRKVRDDFVRDISVGIIPMATVKVEAGESAAVAGRQFSARSDRPLYIRTAWTIGEVSVTPVGADPACKVREASLGDRSMSKALRDFLESKGLAATATVREAYVFLGTLTGADATQAATVRQATDVPPTAETTPVTVPASTPAPETVRGATQTAPTISADDQRIMNIRQRIGDNAERFPELYQQCIGDRDCGVERSAELFRVAAIRGRSNPIPPDGGGGGGVPAGAPAGHVRNHEAECTQEVMAAALLIRQGVQLDHPVFATRAMMGGGRPGTLRAAAPWLARPVNDTVRQQIMDRGHFFAHLSLPDICREAVRLDAAAGRRCRDMGGQEINSRDVDCRYGGLEETVRAAVSGSSLSGMFTTNVNAELLIAYQDGQDTTVGWVQEDDFDNFLKREYHWMGKMSGLVKHGRGKEDAPDTATGEHTEEAQIGRFVGKFTVDEMDLIDNRFGNLQSEFPRDLGLVARQLRPNLVYSKILANPSLSDGTAVFHTDRKNDGSSATFSGPNAYAGYVAMRKQRENGRPLDITPRFLVCTTDLRRDAEIALSNRIILASTPIDGGTVTGSQDPIVKLNLQIVDDVRLTADGVTDPDTETHYVGGADTWFLFAKAGEMGAKTLIVGYRRGTGRAPVMRGYQLTQGQWGLGWDCNLDIGVAWIDGRAVYRGKKG